MGSLIFNLFAYFGMFCSVSFISLLLWVALVSATDYFRRTE